MWGLAFFAGMAALVYWLFFHRRKQRNTDIRRAIDDPTFGVMLLDETTGELELDFELDGARIRCAFGPIDTVEATVALASSIAGRLGWLDRAARDMAARTLLQDANDWRDPDAPEVTLQGFAARMRLEAIQSGIGGRMTFLYDAGRMFAERRIQVVVDQARGPLEARVAIAALLEG